MVKKYVVEIHAKIETKENVQSLRSVAGDVQEWLYTELADANFEPTDVSYEVKEILPKPQGERKFESFSKLMGVLFEEKQITDNNPLDQSVRFETTDGLRITSFTLIQKEGEIDRVVLSDTI